MNLGPFLGDDPLDCLRAGLDAVSIDGVGLEFGVASGTSLRLIAERLPAVGFDSFEGLPEDWRPGWPRGIFAGEYPDGVDAVLVEGLFEFTLPGWSPPGRVALVHVDCDLYSSTRTALTHVGGLLEPGTVIVFDEFHGYDGAEAHEQRAWAEFVAESGTGFVPLGHGPEQFAAVIV